MGNRWLLMGTVAAVALAGCGRPVDFTPKKQPKGKEAWEKREQVYSDKKPEEWLKLLRHRNSSARKQAIAAMIEYGPDYVPQVVEVLRDRSAGQGRMAAALVLAGYGESARAAAPALCEALAQSDWPDRNSAAEALGNIGGNPREVIPAMISALKDKDERVRVDVCRALGRLTREESESISALARSLEDPESNVRAAAANALGQIGRPAASAIAALEKAAQSPDFIVAQGATEALKRVKAAP